jgi:hypothetical protein
MDETESKNIQIFNIMIEKSLFTKRQYEIICNIAKNQHSHKKSTSGAYYRQVKQCKIKIIEVYYSILLLRLIGIYNSNIISLTETISEQLSVILSSPNSDIYNISKLKSVIKSLDDILLMSLNKKKL